MNPIEHLKKRLESRLPGITAVIDRPIDRKGPWHLDLSFKQREVAVEWRPDHGFGIGFRPASGYGEGPDEVLEHAEKAEDRVLELLLTAEPAKGSGASATSRS